MGNLSVSTETFNWDDIPDFVPFSSKMSLTSECKVMTYIYISIKMQLTRVVIHILDTMNPRNTTPG